MRVAPWLLIVLVVLAAVVSLTACDDDDDDDNASGDDDDNDNDTAGDDDSQDDDSPDDDDDDDDDTGDDDDDDDDDGDPLIGPVDIDGDADLEYLYVRTDTVGTYPDITNTYRVEVRNTSTKKAEWWHVYEIQGGTMTFHLADLDADGTFELIETTNVTNPAYVGRITVRDGNHSFMVAFDSGERANVSLYSAGVWDIDYDGNPELCVKASPQFGAGGRGRLEWYEAAEDYALIKQVNAAVDHFIDVYGASENRLNVPVNIAGDRSRHYMTVERSLDGSDWYYELRVRRAENDAVVWSKDHGPVRGFMYFALADVELDGTWEILETKNFYDATYQEYSGKAVVYDGDEDFAVVFNTQLVQDAHLYGYGNYDIDANGSPEILLIGYPESGAGGFLRFYEAADGYNRIKNIELNTDYSGYLLTRGRGGLAVPVDIDGDDGLEYGLVTWRYTATNVVTYNVAIYDKNGGAALWEDTYNLTNGTAYFLLSDLDRDDTYELVEQFNFTQNDKARLAYEGRVLVRDGNDGFAEVFNTGLLGNRQLYAIGDWDVDRDHDPELFIRSRARPDTGEEHWCQWFEAAADYDRIKIVSAPATSFDLSCIGSYLTE